MSPRTPPSRTGRPRLQDLAEAVLAGGDAEDLLELLVHSARSDLSARSALLVMPLRGTGWSIEMVDGPDAPALLGQDVAPDSPLGEALGRADADALEGIDALDVDGTRRPALLAAVDAAEQGTGLLAVLREEGADPVTAADRERLDALAGLVALTLRVPSLGSSAEIDDERSRIARDLHDLAIQELFAVGMELEALVDSLESPGAPPSNARIRSSVAISVQGVENAVAQIRQIVQSLRRERSEATLTEQLRREVGLATAGLGFVPSMRLPPRPAEMDAELPPEIAEDVVAVVRECLANAARHAHATAVAVSISLFSEGVDRVVQVNVSDNGRGIDPSVRRRSGLANISSRARRHSGWVDALGLEPGTMISWRVTLPPA
ncbi:histidine kinase [Brachybacterium saurashtrense]|uniref:Sensor histidine kinase n=1 Tax=Brachybacterium saurashtrense TaxID=556288 RepID=A0A345YN16_9MICO|nr:histidine kinase [Brachybacterium saurashtrense]AXK45318.1 sensor histidine kinase [Brachybacterium saurashtrense]RRR21925.1 sensor histidine kinase [Brachybacterium saurashtrense]